MTTVLAAVENGASSPALLQVARALGASTGADVEALSVREGDPIDTIVGALDREGVSIGVVGRGRRLGAAAPLGPVAQAVVQRARKPVVAVPPGIVVAAPGARVKVLVPVDGTASTALAIAETMRFVGEAEVIALHVFSPSTAPQYSDHSYYDYPDWSRQFLRRWCNSAAVRIVARQGDVVSQVLDVAREEHASLIALAWSQDLSPGRAPAVTGILSKAQVPVLLFPAQGVPGRALQLSISHAA